MALADVGFAGSIDASLPLWTGFASAGIVDTLTVFTTLSLGAGRAVGDTLTIGGSAGRAVRASLSGARIVVTVSIETTLVVGAGLAVTTGRSTLPANTDACSWAVHVNFAGQIACALTVLAGLTRRTSDKSARVVGAA